MSDTIYARPLPPPRSTETSYPELKAMARSMRLLINHPDKPGWARVTTDRGAQYHAWWNGVTA